MGIKITWNANAEADIDKYKVYIQDIATGAFESPVVEVNHPTVEYTDVDGDSTKRYYVSAVDSGGNESALSSPVRITESNTCYVTGYFVKKDGSAAVDTVVKVEITNLPYIYDSQFWRGQIIQATTDISGLVAFTLPRKATVIFSCSDFGINKKVAIPDEANSDLSELSA